VIEALMNQMRRAAQEAGSSQAVTRHGVVTSYDPGTYAVKVELQPDGTLTGWIPLKSPWVGNGWGMFCPPSIGDLVEVDFQEDDGGVGSAGWRFYNDEDRPLPCPAGEFWLVHKDGALLKFHAGGNVELHATTLNTSADAWNHSGPLTVTGGDIKADGISLKTHHHDKVQAGTSLTGNPQ
jgi:phage baseplate assembly protein gpV